ncbi:MAG: HTH-type transcriptional repressor AseR [Deltaproteobacteria bacterium ADurb.Bin135]|nr:MAG: HTH-type transcriptional repressor AseR [Deltaproteobacteria bacterium ADurb.Bin135]
MQSVPNKGTIVSNMGTINEQPGMLSCLFGKTRQSVLMALYIHADEAFYIRQLSRMTNIQMGALQRELKQLSDAGIIHRTTRGHQVYYQANKDCPIFNELKGIIIKTVGIGDVLKSALSSFKERISVAFIYGSFARGDEKKGSDIDLLVIGDISLREAVSSLREAQHTIGREINPNVYPVKEFKSKLAEKHHFLSSVIREPLIFLIGDKDELEKLAGKRLAV